MAGRGPAPKPSHLRQRTNKKPGATTLPKSDDTETEDLRPIPNPDGRNWHELTLKAWENAWASPMASQWLTSDLDAIGRLALLWDEFYKTPSDAKVMAEIRLQESRFGLSPLDRSRLQWEVSRADEVTERAQKRKEIAQANAVKRTGTHDPRRGLMAVK